MVPAQTPESDRVTFPCTLYVMNKSSNLNSSSKNNNGDDSAKRKSSACCALRSQRCTLTDIIYEHALPAGVFLHVFCGQKGTRYVSGRYLIVGCDVACSLQHCHLINVAEYCLKIRQQTQKCTD